MSAERNVEARLLIAAQLDEQASRLAKLARRQRSLETQLRNGDVERKTLEGEIAGLTQALDALGGPLESEAEE